MPKLRLHLDADASRTALHHTLIQRGHDVTRTPNDWIQFNASDEAQLLGATAQGRAIFTFNVRDFQLLAQHYPEHAGIIFAPQEKWRVSGLIAALDHLLATTQAEALVGQVRWLSRRREPAETL